MAELLCPICGRQNSEDREFCDFCGNPLDGALIVEDSSTPSIDAPADDQDEVSRLDSLFSDAEDDTHGSESSLSDSSGPESRLDSYLTPEETPSETESSDDASRLDDYLSPEDIERPLSEPPRSTSPDSQDESSRLDDYFSEGGADSQTLSSPSEEDESSRLDDFFADNILDSPDPFRETGLPSPEESAQTPEDLGAFDLPSEELSLPKELEDKLNGSELDSEPEDPWEIFSEETGKAAPDSSEEWDFLKEEPSQDISSSAEPQSQEESDKGWDFPDFELDDDGIKEAETPEDETSASEWDLYQEEHLSDSSTDAEAQLPQEPDQDWNLPSIESEEEAPEAEVSATEWDLFQEEQLPETPAGAEPQIPQEADEEWDFPAFKSDAESPEGKPAPAAESSPDEWDIFQEESPSGEIPGEEPPAPQEADGGWDFPAFKSDVKGPGEEEAPVEETSPGEWGFLDPSTSSSEQPDEIQPEFDSEGFGEDSGWLDMLQSPGSREKPAEEGAKPKKPQTDWLDKIKRLNKSSDLVDEDSSFPDWLAVSEQPAAQTEDAEEAEPPESSPSEVPDWLKLDDEDSLNEFLRKKDLTNEEYIPQVTEHPSKVKSSEDEDEPASGLSDSQQIKFPSWAGDQKKPAEGQAAPPKTPQGAEPFQIEEEYFDDLFTEELPDWLTTASSGEIGPAFPEELAQGELPGWVEAMRPVVESVDASGLTGDDEYIENYGPLAGIPGVLPAEAEIGINLEASSQKPLDLLITKPHQDYVNLLKKIIGDENKSKTIQKPAPPQTQRVLRWLIAIVLLVATGVTVIFRDIIQPQPPSAAQVRGSGYAALYDEIDTLYDGQPVLIAYDYQPAAAGELQTAAATVVDHLMEQGTYLSFVSTQPTGPALAEQFISSTQAEHGYIHSQKYVNLGYLPGESAGLLSFMIAPKQIIPLAFNGSNAWDSPPLIGVETIADFKMILVITDDPNTAKIWIEQVGTRLEGTPLTMVVSAQVEPLIQPYFRSSPRLLDGYVAGVIDSMNYEQLSARPNLAGKIWLPFNTGIIISVGIIFISGLANGVLSLFSQRRSKLIGETP